MQLVLPRRYQAGPESTSTGVSFRVWAPDRRKVEIELAAGDKFELASEGNGYFSAEHSAAEPGDRYFVRLDDSDERFADPASRYQPQGLAGPSQIIEQSFPWTDKEWPGLQAQGQVLYELHVGTFTPEGTWAAAIGKLDWLQELGITAIEMLPVAEFEGDFGWGYDGVLLYAGNHLYGSPDDLKRFIDAAHARRIGVVLDVVYNHFGAGDRFEEFAAAYFSDEINEWGKSLNFSEEGQRGARDYIVENALYWINEFHFDGLRIDAAHALEDDSKEHIVAEIVRRTREAAAPRGLLLTAESEPQDANLTRAQDKGGRGLDAIWNEDFHHSAIVAATARREAYMHDHAGTASELLAAAKYGLLYQGQRYDWQNHSRGSNAFDLRPQNFVTYLQNHDQVANTAAGKRFWQLTSPSRARAITALFLLAPQTPMLFQGQEFATRSPFFYFLGDQRRPDEVAEGRKEFLKQFQSVRDQEALRRLRYPADPETFDQSKLNWQDLETNAPIARLHRDLIAIRKANLAIRRQPSIRDGGFDGGQIGPEALLLRYFSDEPQNTRLLLVNLGRDLPVRSIADPLSAPPPDYEWEVIWSSEDPAYDGSGRRQIDLRERFTLTGEVALLLGPKVAMERPKLSAGPMKEWQTSIF